MNEITQNTFCMVGYIHSNNYFEIHITASIKNSLKIFFCVIFHYVVAITDFIFLGSKITMDSNFSHEIKTRLLLGKKAMTNLDSVLKSRDITLPAKVHIIKAMVFLVVMYACESWTIKRAERRRIDAFELWC